MLLRAAVGCLLTHCWKQFGLHNTRGVLQLESALEVLRRLELVEFCSRTSPKLAVGQHSCGLVGGELPGVSSFPSTVLFTVKTPEHSMANQSMASPTAASNTAVITACFSMTNVQFLLNTGSAPRGLRSYSVPLCVETNIGMLAYTQKVSALADSSGVKLKKTPNEHS